MKTEDYKKKREELDNLIKQISIEKTDDDQLSRVEVIGMLMRVFPEKKAEEIIRMADEIYTQETGEKSNIRQTEYDYKWCMRFRKYYDSME